MKIVACGESMGSEGYIRYCQGTFAAELAIDAGSLYFAASCFIFGFASALGQIE